MGYRISSGCINCGVCLDHCVPIAIIEQDEQYCIDLDNCTECGICRNVCPVEAIVEETIAEK